MMIDTNLKPLSETKTCTMYIIGNPHMEPVFVNGEVPEPDLWTPLTVTVEWTDGKITDVKTKIC